jgi:hypothetical protein
MSNPVIPGRFTAKIEGDFVVFLIGMRINRWLAFHRWIPTARAMGPMLRNLFGHPETGFLGGETFFRWRGVMFVTYWRSLDDLHRFAHSVDQPHLAAWKRFRQSIGDDGRVGIWHETFHVAAGAHESIYGNMPVFGLAAATAHLPAQGPRATMRGRLGQDESSPAAA